jgi:hypothetical protein
MVLATLRKVAILEEQTTMVLSNMPKKPIGLKRGTRTFLTTKKRGTPKSSIAFENKNTSSSHNSKHPKHYHDFKPCRDHTSIRNNR